MKCNIEGEKTLKHKTINGLLWSGIERFSVQGITFITGILIARQLLPSEYGIIAMLYIFIGISNSLIDSGFSSALVRKTDRNETDNATVFYFNILIGFIMMMALFFSAPFIANFYETPILKPITRLISIVLFFDSFCVVQRALLIAKIDFKTQAKISLSSTVFSGGIGLWLAYTGWGVWALVWQILTASFLKSVLFWFIARWRPTAPFSKEAFKSLFSYGSRLLVSGLISTLYNNLYTLVIGKVFNAASLGNYARARQIAFYPSSYLTDMIQRVTFPVLSRIQNENEQLRKHYMSVIRMSAFIVFPLMLGLVVIAQPLIIWTLTEKWSEAIPLLQVISLGLMWYPIHSINLNVLQVKGRSDLFLRLEIIKDALGVLFLFLTIPLGLLAVCWGQAFFSFICVIINSHYTDRLIGLGLIRQSIDLLPILVTALIMSGIVFLSIRWIETPYLQLIIGIISGGISYIGISKLLKIKELDHIIDLIKRK